MICEDLLDTQLDFRSNILPPPRVKSDFKDFQKSSKYFHYVAIISPWKYIWPFHLNTFEFSLPKDIMCQVWLKLAQEKNFKSCKYIFTLLLLSPLRKKGQALHLPFTHECSVPSLVEIVPWWFWKGSHQCIITILILSSFDKWTALQLRKVEFFS